MAAQLFHWVVQTKQVMGSKVKCHSPASVTGAPYVSHFSKALQVIVRTKDKMIHRVIATGQDRGCVTLHH